MVICIIHLATFTRHNASLPSMRHAGRGVNIFTVIILGFGWLIAKLILQLSFTEQLLEVGYSV